MKHLALDDGRTITLREMTGDYIIPGGSGRCAVNTRMVVGSDVVPTEEYRALSEVLAEYYGTSVLYALDDENQVIGFVSFYPTWCPHFDICSNEQITEALAELEAIKNPPECDDPALHVRCLVIRHEYQGHGIALELLNYLKEWAKDHGWKKIVGNGGIFSGLAQADRPQAARALLGDGGLRGGGFPPAGAACYL